MKRPVTVVAMALGVALAIYYVSTVEDPVLTDVVRMVALALSALIFGITSAIIVLYYRVYRRRKEGGNEGLLPKHVWMIGVSYLIVTFSAATNSIERLGDPPTIFAPLNITGFGVGVYALWLILKHLRRRNDVHSRHDDATVDARPRGRADQAGAS